MLRTSSPAFGKGLRFAAGLLLFVLPGAFAADEYLLPPQDFLATAFEGEPEPVVIWLTGERGETVAELLGHKPPSLRVRYWQLGKRSAWILEEIGKEKLITAGFVVEAGRLLDVRVLAFRESRGWEIRQEFFTRQFDGVTLDAEHSLSRAIDNITGATLSVDAMRRMAKVALYLDHEARDVTP